MTFNRSDWIFERGTHSDLVQGSGGQRNSSRTTLDNVWNTLDVPANPHAEIDQINKEAFGFWAIRVDHIHTEITTAVPPQRISTDPQIPPHILCKIGPSVICGKWQLARQVQPVEQPGPHSPGVLTAARFAVQCFWIGPLHFSAEFALV